MNQDKEEQSSDKLRREAEERLASRDGIPAESYGEESQRLLHELRVHQVELEMQNAELRRTQAALEQSGAKYSDLFDFSPVGHIAFDEHGLLLEANLTIASLLGIERGRLAGTLFQQYMAPEDRELFLEHRRRIFKSGESERCELKLRTRSGRELHAQLDSMPFEEADGVVSCRSAVTDISERKRAENALRMAHRELERRVAERTAELRRSNQALQEFASIASHDMQEPLRKIKAFGDQLRATSADALGEKGRDYLDRMQNAARRMELLLEALLDYSKVSVTARSFAPVDLSILVREVLSDLEVRIRETGGVVEVDHLPAVEADSYQMRQLFQNLISNALKFHGERRPVVKIHAELTEDGDNYRIWVRDNGIGFEQKHLERIFSPFQRLHGRSAYEGTGMGLAICKKIVERHGGSITATSEPGAGATFVITLPAGEDQGGDATVVRDESRSPRKPGRFWPK